MSIWMTGSKGFFVAYTWKVAGGADAAVVGVAVFVCLAPVFVVDLAAVFFGIVLAGS